MNDHPPVVVLQGLSPLGDEVTKVSVGPVDPLVPHLGHNALRASSPVERFSAFRRDFVYELPEFRLSYPVTRHGRSTSWSEYPLRRARELADGGGD